jgi:hypothetical protein
VSIATDKREGERLFPPAPGGEGPGRRGNYRGISPLREMPFAEEDKKEVAICVIDDLGTSKVPLL